LSARARRAQWPMPSHELNFTFIRHSCSHEHMRL
jgi:hypothetical protein